MRASHPSRSAVTRVCSASRSVVTISRPSSSRLTVEARRHDRAHLAQRSVLAGVARRHGPVLPRRQVHAGQELLGHGEQGVGRHLGPSLGPGPCVLLLDGVAHGGDAPPQQLFGHGELLGAQLGQRGVAVGRHRSGGGGAARAGPAGPGGAPTRSRPARSGRSASVAALPARSARASRPGRAGALGAAVALACPGRAGREVRSSRRRRVAAGGRRCAAAGAPRPEAARRGRSPRPSSSRRRPPGTRTTDTPPGPLSRPEPMISMRATFSARGSSLGASTEVTTMPSRSNSASARRMSPTLAPSGRRAPSSEPRGWRAPGARQVHVPSSRLLVSSMSILRVIGVGPRYRRHRHGENTSLAPSPAPVRSCFCGGSENTGQTRPEAMRVP